MVTSRGDFEADAQDVVAVIHDIGDDVQLAVVTTRLAVTTAAGLTELVEEIRVTPDGDGIFHLTITVPEREVADGSPWVVTVLFPPGSNVEDNDPDLTRAAWQEGGRPILSWTGTAGVDPELDVLWKLLRING